MPARQQQRGDDADRLLRVVGAVTERQRGGGTPIPRRARPGSSGASPGARRGGRRGWRASRRAGRAAGETASADSVPSTPTGCQPSSPPQRTASRPPATSAAPTRPPTSACPELDGMPSRQVRRFQVTAAASPAPMTATPSAGATVTRPPIVSATAAPTSSGPSRLHTDAIAIACPGVAARVATRVAIALEASCSPFVTAKAIASSTASARPASIAPRSPAGHRARSARASSRSPRTGTRRRTGRSPCSSRGRSRTRTAPARRA